MHVVGPSKKPNKVHGYHNEEYNPQTQWKRGWSLVIICDAPNNMWGHISVLMGLQTNQRCL